MGTDLLGTRLPDPQAWIPAISGLRKAGELFEAANPESRLPTAKSRPYSLSSSNSLLRC